MHYADCACSGPHSEDEDGAPQEEEAEAPASRVPDVQAVQGRAGGEAAARLRSSEAPEGKTLTVKGVAVSENLIVTSKAKARGKSHDLRMSAEVIEKLSKDVEQKIDEAAGKAKAAGRKTIMAEDLA
jgi:hypothetical protein